MPGDSDTPEDRLQHEAEELMRQRRFGDAAERYGDLLSRTPTDLWVRLGRVSALECAGEVDAASRLLEDTARDHGRSAHLQRFRHLFFVRREDFSAAAASQRALRGGEVLDEGPDDQLADLYFNQGRYREAASELERIAGHELDDGEFKASVLARWGACLRQLGEAEPACERLREALALEPTHHWTLSELAEAERALGDIDDARAHYRAALKAKPDDHWTRGHLAQLEHEDGHTEEAVRLYEEVLVEVPDAAWAKVELAQVLTEKDPARAELLCREALAADPRNPWAHAHLGQLARRKGDLVEAHARFEEAHAAAPGAVWILHELADCCRQLGRRDEGFGHLQRALAEDPYHPITHGYFADFLRGEGKHEQALAYLAKAIEIDPEYLWAWRELGELKALAGDFPAAENAWRKAVELEPDSAINDGLRAFILRHQGRRESALPWLENAIEKDERYQWAWRERLEHLLALNRAAEAENVASQAIAKFDSSAVFWGMRAEARRRQGRRGEAEQDVAKALALDPAIPQVWALAAELRHERGDLPGAVSAAEKAAELAGEAAPEYRTLLAQLLVAAGRHAEASPLTDTIISRTDAPGPAWELAAHLAEHGGDPGKAARILQQAAAGPLGGDQRLAVRRARLALGGGDKAPVQALAKLLDQAESTATGELPWRDLAQVLLQADDVTAARRAAWRALEQSDEGPGRTNAYLLLAEQAVAAGDFPGADAALAEVLRRDPGHLHGHLLAAAAAGQKGDHAAAAAHLLRLDQRFTASGEPTPVSLLRQLAIIHEQAGNSAAARELWQRLVADGGSPVEPELEGDRAVFLIRHLGVADPLALAAVRAAAARLPAGSPAHLRLLRAHALAAAKVSPSDGAGVLLDAEAHLDGEARLLLARLLMAAGEGTSAQVQADLARRSGTLDPDDQREAGILAIRALLAEGRLSDAEPRARTLVQEHPTAEDCATVLGECCAARGAWNEAEAALLAPRLPRQMGPERGLLCALVLFEHGSEAAGLAILGRLAETDQRLPLIRLFAAAWPVLFVRPDPAHPIEDDDLEHVPPFPRLALRLAAAWQTQGRFDLAARHLLTVLRFHAQRHRGETIHRDRHLRAAAIDALCRAGRRRDAWSEAWRGMNLRGILRCCWR